GSGLGTILDDDTKLSIGNATVTEGNSGTVDAVFTVSLNVPTDRTVTVKWLTWAVGTAAVGADFAPVTGMLTFAPGETRKTLAVPVYGDVLDEPDETFYVNLTSPTGAWLGWSQGTGTILDDDAAAPRTTLSAAAWGVAKDFTGN